MREATTASLDFICLESHPRIIHMTETSSDRKHVRGGDKTGSFDVRLCLASFTTMKRQKGLAGVFYTYEHLAHSGGYHHFCTI